MRRRNLAHDGTTAVAALVLVLGAAAAACSGANDDPSIVDRDASTPARTAADAAPAPVVVTADAGAADATTEAAAPTGPLATIIGAPLATNRDPAMGNPETWIQTFHYFTSAPPTNPDVRPAGNVQLNGYSNTANYVFGTSTPEATVRSRADLDKYFTYYDLHGNQTGKPYGTNGLDGLYSNFRSVYRVYPDGDPESVHVFEADHLTLKSHCSGTDHASCGAGQIYQGYLRPPVAYRPGSYVEVCYRMATGNWSWSVPWLFVGEQLLHDPNNASENYLTNDQPNSQTYDSKYYVETDLNDGYTRDADGVARGNYVNAGVPWYDEKTPLEPKVRPGPVYWANSNGYKDRNPFEQLPAGVNLGVNTHCIAQNWPDDGSDRIDVLVDGVVVASFHQEYLADSYKRADGTTKQTAMYLQLSDQTSAYFEPNSAKTTDQGHGWDMDIVSVRSWNNWVTDPPLAGTNGISDGGI